MKRIATAIAVLAGLFGALPALAGEVDPSGYGKSIADSNCTWCHGPSGQGFSTAPRLAGQRRQYIESQLLAFRTHARDNPFSRQYMWGAVAALSPSAAHDVAAYFSMLYAQPADDGDRLLAARGEALYREGIPLPMFPPALPVTDQTRKGSEEFPAWEGSRTTT